MNCKRYKVSDVVLSDPVGYQIIDTTTGRSICECRSLESAQAAVDILNHRDTTALNKDNL